MSDEDKCVVCAALSPRHGGLCCRHRYDEQPPCAACSSARLTTVVAVLYRAMAWMLMTVASGVMKLSDWFYCRAERTAHRRVAS